MNQRAFRAPRVRETYPRLCPICGGAIEEAVVTLSFPDDSESVKIVHQVPAGVCGSCGEEYLSADVAEKLERLLSSPPHDEVKSPVWKYAANL